MTAAPPPIAIPPLAATKGQPEPLGASLDAAGINFAVVSSHATAIAVSIFDEDDREIARVPLPARTGTVFHGHIAGLRPGARYGLRAFGPWAPERGHLFNPGKLLVDPYATALDRPFQLHPSLFDDPSPNPTDTAPWVPKAIVEAEPPPLPDPPPFDWDNQVILELHVRGFTMRHPDVPAAIRGTFAALAHPAVLGHLTGLGVTAVELMPAAAWIDERHLAPLGLTNYWGYNPAAFLAPDPRLAPAGWPEIRATVQALRNAGIATILDVVLNHTGEGDALGPTLSLRGLDDALYYRRTGDGAAPRGAAEGSYVNDTGCGHTLALDRPTVWRLALDALRAWAIRGGFDGFRLDLAATLGRTATGFHPDHPLLAAIAADPVLSRRVLIAEPWDIGPGGYQTGAFPAAWGEWNDRYRDTIRRFWRGDPGTIGDLATRFAGSADIFGPRHRPISRSINFITAHDGFTLADLVSHAQKHNQANGEFNRDGTDNNLSWNNRHEGPIADLDISAARARDVRALLATLLLSRGTPMLSMGDECGRTQSGNNNAYAQDNETSWMDWDGMDQDLLGFASRLIALRRASPALRDPGPLTGGPVDASGLPDVVWLTQGGRAMEAADWENSANRTLIACLHAAGDTVLIVLHAGFAPFGAIPPDPPPRMRWRIAIDSADPAREGLAGATLPIAARSAVVLRAESTPPKHGSRASAEDLDRLCEAAGLATAWWDIEGKEHRPGGDTKRALLASMGLPADTSDDVRGGLQTLSAPRPLPRVLTAILGQTISVPIGQHARSTWVALLREDGVRDRIPVRDGQAMLAPPPIGRHTLTLDDDPDTACHLTVAPGQCFLPTALTAGQRRFGIAAHLYALRSTADRGIGDFGTLRELTAAAANAGAAAVGLNPLHALFPGDRSRASPYHPSHRGFLDPIYIDLDAFPGGDPAEFAALAALPAVDYPGVWAAKRAVLAAAFASGGASEPGLDEFIAREGRALRDFAHFEAIAAHIGHTDWPNWPEPLRRPGSPAVAAFGAAHAADVRFVQYLQWIAGRQLAEAAATDLSIGLYRDLAIGCAPDGAESWANQATMLRDVSIGAPPDPFSATGQVWGLPPPNPLAMAREGFATFAALLSANMRHAGALRIDHVMGLNRLFLVPSGARAAEGTYLAFPFADLLGQLTLESFRHRCLVVGEDLGTVPEGMRERLAAARVLSYRVLWFEKDGTTFRPPAAWPMLAAACVSTHDLPTVRGWWTGADIDEQAALGLTEPEAARAARDREKEELIAFARSEGIPDGAEHPVAAMHALIAATPGVLALAQADDLAGETIGVNLPGTDRERPNWRRRLPRIAADLRDGPDAAGILDAMRAAGRAEPAEAGVPAGGSPPKDP